MSTTTTTAVNTKSITTAKKVKKEAQPSRYRNEVLEPHALMRKEMNSVGAARSIILTFPGKTPAKFIKLLKLSKTPENYKVLCNYFPASKFGTYTAFRLRQILYKYEAKLNEEMKK